VIMANLGHFFKFHIRANGSAAAATAARFIFASNQMAAGKCGNNYNFSWERLRFAL